MWAQRASRTRSSLPAAQCAASLSFLLSSGSAREASRNPARFGNGSKKQRAAQKQKFSRQGKRSAGRLVSASSIASQRASKQFRRGRSLLRRCTYLFWFLVNDYRARQSRKKPQQRSSKRFIRLDEGSRSVDRETTKRPCQACVGVTSL